MRIAGKLKSSIFNEITNEVTLTRVGDVATIELPPVDLAKIEPGDEVWVRGKYNQNGFMIDYGETVDIIHHIPTPEKPGEAKLPIRFSQEYCIDNLIAKKINALIDVVREIAGRVK